jgi:hypothetical protein
MSSTGGSTWQKMVELYRGYCISKGSIDIGGSWDHDNDANTNPVMAVFRSDNQGLTWSKYPLNSTQGEVYNIAVDPADPSTIYAGGGEYDASTYQYIPHFFKTKTGGADWEEIISSSWYSSWGCKLQSIAIDPFDSGRIWAGFSNGIYATTDSGKIWQLSKEYTNTTCLIAHPGAKDLVFCGTYWDGVLYSIDGGTTWNSMNEGLYPHAYVYSMDLDLVNNCLYIGTGSNGVFRYNLGTLDVDDESNQSAPESFILYPNHPNPFNGTTRIMYELKNQIEIKLDIWDIRGRVVVRLKQGFETAGTKNVTWDGKDEMGRDVSSGIYILKLQAGDKVKSLKMVLQR